MRRGGAGRRRAADPGLPVSPDRSASRGGRDRQGHQRQEGTVPGAWDMTNVVAKITASGNPNVLVTERGASFGYNTLVSDMRALPILARTTGAPVIFDAT